MLLWIILFLPLISFAVISLLFLKREKTAAIISTGSAILGAGLTIFLIVSGSQDRTPSISWLQVGDFHVTIDLLWDRLAQLMALIVTCVGALIHIYSWGYMSQDDSKPRYFAYLSLFMFSMLGIVFSSNFIMMFIFWELVGFSSYLLIGFWYQKPSAAEAGKKAFLVNKLGDFGFILGIILVWVIWRSVDFRTLAAKSDQLRFLYESSNEHTIPLMVVALLLFCGAVGKSAQFPLHVWLPDAMEGPTPVSALIHAATMVAAGVYMLCRIFFILSLSTEALTVIAWVGGITSLFAALWAIAQDDIKRILAYSTLSQLGYMVMSVGLMAPGGAMFHLTTHACFKALLFLAAGSVIVGLHHEQNIWKMGGLWSKMRITSWTFLLGLLALCGFPFFSGALSKDEILFAAYHQDKILFSIGVFTAFLTAFYMGRLFIVAFLGKSRDHHHESVRENGFVMTLPLCILAVFCLSTTWHHLPFVADSLKSTFGFHDAETPSSIHTLLIFVPLLGLGSVFALYLPKNPIETQAVRLGSFNRSVGTEDPLNPSLRKFLASKFWFDEIYNGFVKQVQDRAASFLRIFDTWIVDGIGVQGLSLGTYCFGNLLRCFQTGNLQTYAVFFGLALVAMIFWALIR